MSFRLTNAPVVFMDLINRVFEEHLDKFIIVFIHDILVYSRIIEKNELHFNIVLEKLREKKLYAKFLKCEFWLGKFTFLGHVISEEGVSMDPLKVEVVRQ